MRRHHVSTFALLAATALALSACNTNDGRAPTAQPVGQLQGSDATHLDQSEQAPFVLSLSGPKDLPAAGGEVAIEATITSARGFAAPATISVVLPKGATLASGLAQESLPSIAAGTTRRSFKVLVRAGSSEPIRVAVDARSADGAMGAHAERLLPEVTAFKYDRNRAVPPPPVSRPIGHAPTR